MAGFCENCGAPLTGGPFCPACGTKVPVIAAAPVVAQGTVPPARPTPSYAPSPGMSSPPPKGGGALKIILIVLGILGFLTILAMGSCFYVAYKVKQKAAEFTHAEGSENVYHGTREACSVISAGEVSEAIGQTAVQDENSTSTDCRFRFGNDHNAVLSVQFTWQGGAIAMKITRTALKHAVAGMETLTPLPGVGDEAYVGAMGSTLMMRKGDVLVNIDLRQAGLNVDAGKKIATQIATRL